MTAEGLGDTLHDGWLVHSEAPNPTCPVLVWQLWGWGPRAECGGQAIGEVGSFMQPRHCLVPCQGEDGFPGFKGDMGIKGDRVSVLGVSVGGRE